VNYIISKENIKNGVENKDRALVWGVEYFESLHGVPYFLTKNVK
jgi:hypothetical protein